MYKKRIKKVKNILEEKGIATALVTKDENKFYLSGFASSNYYILLTKERDYLITDFRYIEMAQQKSDLFEIVKLQDQQNGIFDFLKNNFAGQTIAVEEENITYAFFNDLFRCAGLDGLVSQENVIEKVRIIKDETECAAIAKAAAIAEKGLSYLLPMIKPGMSEQEAALELEFFIRRNGGQKLSFESIVVSGENSSLPHGKPGERKFKNGDMITLDFGCVVDGYCSDMTRTVALGSVTHEQKKVYEIVKKAQREAAGAIKAGIRGKEADKVARTIITETGYGAYFGHGLGHGVGLEIHEAPRLNTSSEEELKENMIVSIEPGIYIPGQFGVRIEDLAIVKNGGIINLCQSSKELIIL